MTSLEKLIFRKTVVFGHFVQIRPFPVVGSGQNSQKAHLNDRFWIDWIFDRFWNNQDIVYDHKAKLPYISRPSINVQEVYSDLAIDD